MKIFFVLLTITLSLTALADTNYSCVGVAPYWSLKIEGENAISSTGQTTKTEQIFSITSALGTPENSAFVITTESGATASIIAGECTSGMSKRALSHHVLYKNEENIFYGCCEEQIAK